MKAALWIIAICEVIRAAQNMLQIWLSIGNRAIYENSNKEFVKSLKRSDREFVREMLKEFDEQEGAEDELN